MIALNQAPHRAVHSLKQKYLLLIYSPIRFWHQKEHRALQCARFQNLCIGFT